MLWKGLEACRLGWSSLHDQPSVSPGSAVVSTNIQDKWLPALSKFASNKTGHCENTANKTSTGLSFLTLPYAGNPSTAVSIIWHLWPQSTIYCYISLWIHGWPDNVLQSRINTCFNESLKWDLANGKSEEQRVLFHRGKEQAILETDQSTAQSSGRERERDGPIRKWKRLASLLLIKGEDLMKSWN